jgi:hypothetical protein
MNLRHAAALALAGWYLTQSPYNQNIFRCNLNGQARSDLGLSQIAGNAAIAQAQTNSLGETAEEEQQRLREAEQKVNDVIAKYKTRLNLRHVDYIRAGWYPEHGGYIIAVFADKAENVGELERSEPSSLDGYPVVVLPPNIGEAL